MKNSNNFFHGPEDRYVSDIGMNILGKGSFTVKKDIWKF